MLRERPGVREAGDWRDRRTRPHVEENPLARQHARAAVAQTHLQRFRRHEPPVPHDQLGAALLVQVQVQSDQPLDHLALALAHLGHVNRDGARHDPELRGMVQQVGDFRAPDLVLAGQAVDVRAGPADPAALDDRDAAPGASPGARPATCRPLRCQARGLRTIPPEAWLAPLQIQFTGMVWEEAGACPLPVCRQKPCRGNADRTGDSLRPSGGR